MGNKNANGMQEEVLSKRESSHRSIRMQTNTCTRTGAFECYRTVWQSSLPSPASHRNSGKEFFPFPDAVVCLAENSLMDTSTGYPASDP